MHVVGELPLETLFALESKRDEISGQRAWPGSLLLAAFSLGTTISLPICRCSRMRSDQIRSDQIRSAKPICRFIP